ncbi:hypothetical protein C0J52_13564 [Blattella germanica]|nr:hypothetical protein C0J52_13564 [Blattella germanica]
MICNKDFKNEYRLSYNVTKSASMATGVSISLVTMIMKDGRTPVQTMGRLNFSTSRQIRWTIKTKVK